MTDPVKKRPAEISEKIQSSRSDIDKLGKKQDTVDATQTQSWRWELRHDRIKGDEIQKRPSMPPIFKPLATGAAWVLSILGFMYLLAGFGYVVLSGFGLFSLTISAGTIAIFAILGIVHLLLAYVAMMVRRSFEWILPGW